VTYQPPVLLIRFEFEAPPRIVSICANEGEQRRLADWLLVHPRYADLIEAAYELEKEARAA